MDTVMVWQGQIYSGLITTSGAPYEFNPNSQLLDPNLNEVCDPTWKNVTTTLAKHNLKLGWFGRPCNHILQPDHSSATIECPSKTCVPLQCVAVRNHSIATMIISFLLRAQDQKRGANQMQSEKPNGALQSSFDGNCGRSHRKGGTELLLGLVSLHRSDDVQPSRDKKIPALIHHG
eukprot:COSAG02_NODE_1659_length_11458_cov_2.406638_7_plen_176_part_00